MHPVLVVSSKYGWVVNSGTVPSWQNGRQGGCHTVSQCESLLLLFAAAPPLRVLLLSASPTVDRPAESGKATLSGTTFSMLSLQERDMDKDLEARLQCAKSIHQSFCVWGWRIIFLSWCPHIAPLFGFALSFCCFCVVLCGMVW